MKEVGDGDVVDGVGDGVGIATSHSVPVHPSQQSVTNTVTSCSEAPAPLVPTVMLYFISLTTLQPAADGGVTGVPLSIAEEVFFRRWLH